jgi:hypothetical protein
VGKNTNFGRYWKEGSITEFGVLGQALFATLLDFNLTEIIQHEFGHGYADYILGDIYHSWNWRYKENWAIDYNNWSYRNQSRIFEDFNPTWQPWFLFFKGRNP